MKELGLTQEDLCPALGVKTRGAVGHYLNGRRDINTKKATALAEKLEMSMSELFGSEGLPIEGPAEVKLDQKGIYVIDEPENYLNPANIALLQDCMIYAVQTKNILGLDVSERAVAIAAASYFNHCLKYNVTPENITPEIRDAVLSTALGSDA